MLDALLTTISVVIGLYVAARVIRRVARHQMPRIEPYILSSREWMREVFPLPGSQRSYAVERGLEPLGTGVREHVPDLSEQLAMLTDDGLLDVLSRVKTPDNEYRFADSRIAKFVGGRIEGRVEQVRAVRGKQAPPPQPARVVQVREHGGPPRAVALE